MSRLIAVAALACAIALVSSAADAKPQRQKQQLNDAMTPTERMEYYAQGGQEPVRSSGRRVAYGDAQIVAHPAGCPARLFCGCGVSVKVFGKPVRELYLAGNWLRKFPSASPGAGMVAANYRHVMLILSYNGDGTALVYDPNSGGHLTRIHVRPLAGYRIVNPNARVALQ